MRIDFPTLEAFQREYRKNIANGGIFVESHESFQVSETLIVELRLGFRDQSIALPGEVVSHVPPRFVPPGGRPGAAIQMLQPASRLRERLEPIVGRSAGASGEHDPRRDGGDERRRSRRGTASVDARVATRGLELDARTFDLSRSGALLSVDATPLPIGQAVNLTLVHPTRGNELQVSGRVVRHAIDASGAPVAAVEFEPAGEADEASDFIESVQAAEHARQLGAIAGPIELLGFANLLQMFASGADRGTLHAVHGSVEGIVAFESGALVHASFGLVGGQKALSRMLALRSGSFEFRVDVDVSQSLTESPLPIYGAVLEAMTKIDELKRLDTQRLPPSARISIDPGRLAEKDAALDPIEQEIVEIAEHGTTVRNVLDGLPGYDSDLYAALLNLLELGIVTL